MKVIKREGRDEFVLFYESDSFGQVKKHIKKVLKPFKDTKVICHLENFPLTYQSFCSIIMAKYKRNNVSIKIYVIPLYLYKSEKE